MTKRAKGVANSINALLSQVASGKTVPVKEEVLAEFGVSVAKKLQKALTARTDPRPPKTLYMSEIGQPCTRRLWYAVNSPEIAEHHSPATLVKFLYGDMLEDVILALAKLAGNAVEGEQESLVLKVGDWEIRGRRDAVINGEEWDVKTASGYGMKKFKDGLTPANDSFGYVDQLNGYALVSGKKTGGFLVLNKESGEIIDSKCPTRTDIKDYIAVTIKAIEGNEEPPREYVLEEDESGNHKLCTSCGYCPYKWKCYEGANDGTGLRMFQYSNKIVYLVNVVKEPRVKELRPWEDEDGINNT
jgi:hypothetical protein